MAKTASRQKHRSKVKKTHTAVELRKLVELADGIRTQLSSLLADCDALKQSAVQLLTHVETNTPIEDLKGWLPRTLNTLRNIQKEAAAFAGCSMALLRSHRNKGGLRVVRLVAVYISRHHTNASTNAVGKAFNRNHSSILSAVKRVEKELTEGNEDFCDVLWELEYRLGYRNDRPRLES